MREASRDVESASKVVHDSKLFGKSETKVVTRIDEFFWRLELAWELTVFAGAVADGADEVRLHGCSGSCEIMSSTRQPPRPETVTKTPLDTSLTWPLQQLSVFVHRSRVSSVQHLLQCLALIQSLFAKLLAMSLVP